MSLNFEQGETPGKTLGKPPDLILMLLGKILWNAIYGASDPAKGGHWKVIEHNEGEKGN